MYHEEKISGDIKITSPFFKKVENFFYHYKWHTIVALFLIVTITICSVQMCSKDSYDVYVMYAGNRDIKSMKNEGDVSEFSKVYKSLTEQLKAQHIACVVDAFGDALSLAVQAKPLLIKPNLEEFCTSFSQDISLLKTEKDTCKAIVAAYKRTDVQILCSMDKRGAIYA